MLHTVDQNDLVVIKDLVDDAIVTTPRRPETLKFSNKGLAEAFRVLSNRSEDGLQGSVAHLLRESIEMAEALSRDLDLVHPATSNVVFETHTLAFVSVPARMSKRLHQIVVLEDVECFLKGLEVVRAQ
jgi:hypothetical protein